MTLSRRAFLTASSAAVLAACSKERHAPEPTGSSPTGSPPTAASRTTGATVAPKAAGGPAAFLAHGPAAGSGVAFTFHGSGDPGLLHELLAAAGRAGAPLTIFAVGSWLDEHPDIAHDILAGGHELANHTYTHPALGRSTGPVVAEEITRCREALSRHAGAPGAWFRPSGLDVPTPLILEEAARAGYATVVGYDIDPLDYQDPPAATIVDRVASRLHPGAVVSLHTGHPHTVAAFEPMVAEAHRRQLVPVLVRDLLTKI